MFLLPSPSSSPSSPQQFSRFPELPPEIRHQIWLAAVPSPGINFFNVHVIPNDHPGANRSTSPPLARLDVRRLDIDDDDEHIATYDPSAWRARDALRCTCREARLVCAIPEGKSAHVILTRPRRGLFVRAGDGQLRQLTPLKEPQRRPWPTSVNADGGGGGDLDAGLAAPVAAGGHSTVATTTQQSSSAKSLGERETENKQQKQQPQQQTEPEPLIYRTIRVHIDDMLCLSVENCSFNLPWEESPLLRGASDFDNRSSDYDDDDDEDPDADLGWVYDPQFHPPLPSSIPPHRYCINLARGYRISLRAVQDIITGLIQTTSPPPCVPSQTTQPQYLVMLDAVAQDPGGRTLAELNPALAAAAAAAAGNNEGKNDDDAAAVAVFRDRYGDRYAPLPWDSRVLQARSRLTKLWPEANDVRERYLRSALLPSPKRPHTTTRSLYGQYGA
ncbi:hypothetical protein F5X96DRAFT_133312 [Biscogniauxia mediterranea]|nr:hypothetical protein F5X96DRAFT_133312 [Biscogniauxia mediterranea]